MRIFAFNLMQIITAYSRQLMIKDATQEMIASL